MPVFGGARTVAVTVTAKMTDYLASMRAGALATRDFAKAAGETSQKHKRAWGEVGTSALAVGGAIGLGVGLAVKSFADFDKAMSRAAAGTQATGRELTDLRAAAIKAGADTQFSATEAADAITAMGKAGVSTNDILSGGLKGSLDLAAAGELAVGDAAEIAATALTQFGLAGKDLPHVADLLAAGAGKAQGEVSDLANALKYVGPIARGMNVSIEETVGVIAELASQGIIGEQAGTSFRGMLSTLSSPSKAAAKEMKALGINVYDATGNFVGMEAVAGQLHGALSGMTQAQRDAALGIIFGNEQLTAARVLYSGGAAEVVKWTKAVNDQGFASEQAAKLTDNLAGDIERLGGSLSSAFITSGSGANDALRDLVQTASKAVNVFNDLPPELQAGTLQLAALTAGTLLLGGASIKAVAGVVGLQASLVELGVSAGAARAGLIGVASAFGVVAVAAGSVVLGDYIGKADAAEVASKGLSTSLLDLGKSGKAGQDALDLFSTGMGPFRQSAKDTEDLLGRFGRAAHLALDEGWNARLGRIQNFGAAESKFAEQTAQLDAAFAGLVKSGNVDGAQAGFAKLAKAATDTGVPYEKLIAQFPQYAAALEATNASATQAGAAGTTQAKAMQALTEANRRAKEAQDALTNSLDASKNAFLQLQGGQIAYEASLDAATDAVKANGKTLDVHTEKGRANATALNDQAKAALGYLSQLRESGAPAKTFNGTLDQTRAALEKAAVKFGMTKAEAKKYVDQVLAVPKMVDTTVNLHAEGALQLLSRVATDLKNIDGTVAYTRIVTTSVDKAGVKHISSAGAKATGGQIPAGMGTPGRDSVHALVMPREFIQPTASVDYYGVGFMEAVRTRTLPKLADGGFVGRVMSTVPAPKSGAGRGGDTYVVNASTTEARALVREQQYQKARLDAVRGTVGG